MPDLLTHVLVVYAFLTPLTWYSTRVQPRYVGVAVMGTLIPDLAKIGLVLTPGSIETLLGLPFSWLPLHRLGGVILVVGMVAVLSERAERRPIATYAFLGAITQFPLDGLIRRANDVSPPYLYPVTWWRPPAGNVYLSSDIWPVIPALGIAVLVWWTDRNLVDKAE